MRSLPSTAPAYRIALSAQQKRKIGEIAAIQSQIDWLMQLTVKNLTDVKFRTATVILGSTNFGANALTWITLLREMAPNEEALAWAEWAYAQTSSLARSRNDFLHTLFGDTCPIDPTDSNGVTFGYGHRPPLKAIEGTRKTGVRVKSQALVPLANLDAARNNAAYLSLAFAHIAWVTNLRDEQPSPWLRRLGRRLPPQS